MASCERKILLLIVFMSIALIYHNYDSVSLTPRRQLIDDGYYIDSLNEFPPIIFSYSEIRAWAWIFYFFGMLYCFVGIAIVCDDYFVPAVEVIADKLEMSEDTAGATWLAIGTSAPELFTAFVGTFVAKSDVGFGTIIGSAVFNILLIIGACAIFTAGDLKLQVWSFARDMIYFVICLGILALFYGGISENQFFWWECVILLLLYVLYVVLMKYNENIKSWFYHKYIYTQKEKELLAAQPDYGTSGGDMIEPKDLTPSHNIEMSGREESERSGRDIEISQSIQTQSYHSKHEESSSYVPSKRKSTTIRGAGGDHFIRELYDDTEIGEGLDLSFPDGAWKRISYIIQAPLTFAIYITCFDITKEENESWWPWTFTVALLWLGGLSYLMVWWAVCVGYAWFVPQEIMGLVFLAFGTSVPELFACVIVAKKGKADMAIAGSIGSNIFDILVGLPLPWLTFALTQADLAGDIKIDVQTHGLFWSILVLIAMMAAVTVLIIINKWILTHCTGWTMVVLYLIFVAQDLVRYYFLD